MLKHLSKYSITGLILIVFTAQILNAQTYCEGDEFVLHAESYVSGELQWQYSFDNINWSDYYGETVLTCTIVPESNIYIRLKITDPECMPEYYAPTEYIELLSQPSEAYAGEDQLNVVVTTTTLTATAPEIGAGFWAIISGDGGNITNPSDNNSEFSGNAGETYNLRWLVYNNCGNNSDYVTISFADAIPFACGDPLVDTRDNQSYPTVEIGGRCWMAANLNVGTQLIGNINSTDNSQIEKYCYGDDSNKCDIYGALYQWNEAMGYSTTQSTQGICPTGWHIPSDAEVKQLEISLGMTEADANLENTWRGLAQGVGTAMKEGGSSGFNVKLTGVRFNNGVFMHEDNYGYIWCSTEGVVYSSATYAYRRCWVSSNAGVGRYDSFPKTYSYPIRCVKD